MEDFSADDLEAARPPIASLLSKSEKAQQKLKPGTWQHTMLDDNIRALRIAWAFLDNTADVSTHDDLRAARKAIASMIERTQSAGSKFAPGTSQHTLQKNRLHALRVAEALVAAEMDTNPDVDQC